MIDLPSALKDLQWRIDRPHEALIEHWQMEQGISTLRWTVTDPVAGPWARGVSGGYIYCSANPALNETARIRSNQIWQAWAGSPTNLVARRCILEFEFHVSALANLDNAICFWGFTETIAATRATNNLCGFGLAADVLETVSDAAGAETTNTGFGETLTNHNKLRVELCGIVGTAQAFFYLNDELIASHLASVPAIPMYLNWYFDTEATGACICDLGTISAWYEYAVRNE